GPSGCGKSTFLRSINRTNDLIPTSSNQGEIIYEDVNLLDDNINVISLRKEIGMVFQKPNPFPKSIYNNIAYSLKFYGIKIKQKLDRIVEDSLKKVGLWEEVKYRIHESALAMSCGILHCICFVRMIALELNVFLLD